MTGLGEYTTEELEAELELRKQELPAGYGGDFEMTMQTNHIVEGE